MFLSVRKRSDSNNMFLSVRQQQHVFVCAKAKRQQQHEGRHDVGHFGNATGRGVFTDAGRLVVIAWMR